MVNIYGTQCSAKNTYSSIYEYISYFEVYKYINTSVSVLVKKILLQHKVEVWSVCDRCLEYRLKRVHATAAVSRGVSMICALFFLWCG